MYAGVTKAFSKQKKSENNWFWTKESVFSRSCKEHVLANFKLLAGFGREKYALSTFGYYVLLPYYKSMHDQQDRVNWIFMFFSLPIDYKMIFQVIV